MSNHYLEPLSISKNGQRCVVETNWEQADGPARCQMIWESTHDGGARITTCRPDMDPIRLTSAQCSGLAFWLRKRTGGE